MLGNLAATFCLAVAISYQLLMIATLHALIIRDGGGKIRWSWFTNFIVCAIVQALSITILRS